MKSFELIENVPIYARSLDEHGLLEHLANAVQPQIDSILRTLDLRDIFFDPRTCPPRFLPFLAQFWGLASEGDHWQGIGLNPAWADDHTRKVIQRIPTYWVQKGTDWGIREAIALWLQWEAAHTTRLDIRLPFGNTPTAHLPQWWDYATCYDAFLNETWRERQQYGSGDYPQRHRPDFELLAHEPPVQDGYEVWSDRVLAQLETPTIDTVGSALGPERPWMHFDLLESEWNKVIPDIVKLNPEIWSSFAEPEVFAWLGYQLRSPLVLTPSVQEGGAFRLEEQLVYDGFKYGDWWHYEAGTPIPVSTTTTTTETFELTPGHGYADVWQSGETPTPYDYLYYVPGATRTITQTETTLEARTCSPGFLGTIQTGIEPQMIGNIPAVPPSAILNRYDPFDYTLEMNGLSFEDNRPDPYLPVPTLDLTGIAPLALTDLNALTYTTEFLGYEVGVEYQYLPRIAFDSLPTFFSEPVFLLAEPKHIMLYHDVWNSGYEYYYAGAPTVTGTLQDVPVFSDERLCNVVDRYSMKLIERTIVRVPLPITDLDVFDAYPLLRTVSVGDNWQLLVETTDQLYLLKPVTLFWSKRLGAGSLGERSQSIDLDEPQCLYMEFLFTPLQTCFLTGTSLLLEHQSLQSRTPPVALALDPNVTVGIKVAIPFQSVSGTQTLAPDATLVESTQTLP